MLIEQLGDRPDDDKVARLIGNTTKVEGKNKEAALRAASVRHRAAIAAVVALRRWALQAHTGGKSGMNPSDRDIAVLKIPLDIGSPPLCC